MSYHGDLFESGRWFELSIIEQLANIGSEIERTIKWKNAGDEQTSKIAFLRALELIKFTVADPKNRGAGLREVVRSRESLVDHFMFDNEYNSTDEQWQKYFMWITWLAAIERRKQRQKAC